MFWTIIYAVVFSVVLLLGRMLYVVQKKTGKKRKGDRKSVKTLVILGSGGHTTEILQIVKNLNFERYRPRIYVYASSDNISYSKIDDVETNNRDFETVKISRSREVGQSYVTSVWTTIISLKDSVQVLWEFKPDLILCNGPGTCVPICIAAFLMKLVFLSETTIIFVESFCRVKTFSLSGKILYYIADHVIVQWPQLCKSTKNHKTMCNLAPIIGAHFPWDVIFKNLEENIPVEIKIQLTSMCQNLQSALETNEAMAQNEIDDSLLRLEVCVDQTWEALNTGYWKDVSINYRYSYTLCTAIKCIFLEMQCSVDEENEKNMKRKKMIDIIEQVDKAILLGAPLPDAPHLMTEIASRLNTFLTRESTQLGDNEIPIDDSEITMELLDRFVWIERFEKPSMETFHRDIFKPKSPALLEKCLSHWKALKSWKNMDYLIKMAGNRTVPIEIGSRYTEEDWSQSLVSFAEFLQSHISKKDNKIGYLAQHQLFEQIPEMKDDFSIPDYCNFSDTEDDACPPDINAWFGPRGTVSPLHFDPKNNLLCQVFGYKRLILYHPEESSNLYSYETRLLSNTAQVDPLNPDFDKWPKFKEAKGLMCYLKPGDMAFIPPGWWHHVESLTPSFSISFWWC